MAVSLLDGALVKDSSNSSSPLSEKSFSLLNNISSPSKSELVSEWLSEKSFSLLNNLSSPSKSLQLRLVEHGPDLNARETLISIELIKNKIFFQK